MCCHQPFFPAVTECSELLQELWLAWAVSAGVPWSRAEEGEGSHSLLLQCHPSEGVWMLSWHPEGVTHRCPHGGGTDRTAEPKPPQELPSRGQGPCWGLGAILSLPCPSGDEGQVNRASHVGAPPAPAMETLVRRDIPENSSPYHTDNKKEKENTLHQ